MKKVLKALGALLGLLVVAIGASVAFILVTWHTDYSSHAKPALVASTEPEVIARGEYLVNAIAHCSTCHGPGEQMETHAFSVPNSMEGGNTWRIGPLGTLVAPNLTSDPATGIGALSDGELARAIRHGVDRRGDLALFMLLATGPLADEDLVAVMSYLRSLPPVSRATPRDELGLLGKWLVKKLAPKSPTAPAFVKESDTPSLERGRYLALGPAACVGCHSHFDLSTLTMQGDPLAGEPHADPDPTNPAMEIASPNLTPDPTTGHIATWTQEQFVKRLRGGRALRGSKMPWEAYARMTESDAASLWLYLRSLPSVERLVGPTVREKGWKPPQG